MTRVIYCFSSYSKFDGAFRFQISPGKGDHKESQFPDLWLEANHFSAINLCSVCLNQSHISSSCEEKLKPSSEASLIAQTTRSLTVPEMFLP